jgi:hypothetical protein
VDGGIGVYLAYSLTQRSLSKMGFTEKIVNENKFSVRLCELCASMLKLNSLLN